MNVRNIAFIGGGNMAQSLMRGLIDAGRDAAGLIASDPDDGCRAAIDALGVRTTMNNQAAVDCADILVLAVKPQMLAAVLAGLAVPADTLIVSICAGVPSAGIAGLCAREQPIVRAMPNTPALLRTGVTGLYANAFVAPADQQAAEAILSAVGKVFWVADEAALDAVTAVSGSGPAYFFYLMEAMIEAGRSLGLSAELATALTVGTALGAARMAGETELTPSMLRRNVTSPGGTTEGAINTFEEHGVRRHIVAGLGRAHLRSRELAEEFGSK